MSVALPEVEVDAMRTHAVQRRREGPDYSSVCAWCTAPRARRPRAAQRTSHGMCPTCLARLRPAYSRAGSQFWVWDPDARSGAEWASELAAVERSSRAAEPPPVERQLAHARAKRVRVDA